MSHSECQCHVPAYIMWLYQSETTQHVHLRSNLLAGTLTTDFLGVSHTGTQIIKHSRNVHPYVDYRVSR